MAEENSSRLSYLFRQGERKTLTRSSRVMFVLLGFFFSPPSLFHFMISRNSGHFDQSLFYIRVINVKAGLDRPGLASLPEKACW